MKYLLVQNVQGGDKGATFIKMIEWPVAIPVGDTIEMGEMIFTIEHIRHRIDGNHACLLSKNIMLGFNKQKEGAFDSVSESLMKSGFEISNVRKQEPQPA